MTPTHSFKVTPFFGAEYLRNGTTYRNSDRDSYTTYATVSLRMTLSVLAKYSMTRNVGGLSATAELLVLSRDAMHSADYGAVTHRYSVETAKYIIKIFSLSGSHAILVFPYQMVWQYSDGTPYWGFKCTGYGK